jgi:hypothetical protein
MISRAQRTPFGEWWWTVDRLTLAAIGALMLAGIVLSLAASPPVAARLGLDPFFFVNRHILYVLPAIAVMLSVSFLSPRQIRRLSLMIFVVSLIMVAATPYFGPEIKGARRWLVLLGVNIQPSEFIKPAFVIIVAWLFGESAKRPDMPANTFSLILLLTVIALLVVQPDFRPDDADCGCLERALFHGRDAARLGCRHCGARRDRSVERLLHGAARGAPHSALSRSGLWRYLQHRYRHRKLHARWLVRQRARVRAP